MSSAWEKYNETSNKVGAKGCSVGTLIGLALPISMIVMGGIHLDNCPAERYIPIYLMVSGSFAVFLAVVRVIGNFLQDDEGRKPVALERISGLISIFLFAWFIAGNVWIYRLYDNYSTDPAAPNYCDNTFYLYAFWVTTLTYILIALGIVFCCCTCICAMCCRSGE